MCNNLTIQHKKKQKLSLLNNSLIKFSTILLLNTYIIYFVTFYQLYVILFKISISFNTLLNN